MGRNKLIRDNIAGNNLFTPRNIRRVKTVKNTVVVNGKQVSKNNNETLYYLGAGQKIMTKNGSVAAATAVATQEYLSQAASIMDGLNCTVDMTMKKDYTLLGDDPAFDLNNADIDNQKEWSVAKNTKKSIGDRFADVNNPIYALDARVSDAEYGREQNIMRTRENLRKVTLAADLVKVNIDAQYDGQLNNLRKR